MFCLLQSVTDVCLGRSSERSAPLNAPQTANDLDTYMINYSIIIDHYLSSSLMNGASFESRRGCPTEQRCPAREQRVSEDLASDRRKTAY